MCPTILNQNLHFIDQTIYTRLGTTSSNFMRPLLQPSFYLPRFKKSRSRPSTDAVPPDPPDAGPERRPQCCCCCTLVHGGVCVGIITHADMGIQPHPAGVRQRVVGVDEAAFWGFEVVACERVGDAAELEGSVRVEWGGVECDFFFKEVTSELGHVFGEYGRVALKRWVWFLRTNLNTKRFYEHWETWYQGFCRRMWKGYYMQQLPKTREWANQSKKYTTAYPFHSNNFERVLADLI